MTSQSLLTHCIYHSPCNVIINHMTSSIIVVWILYGLSSVYLIAHAAPQPSPLRAFPWVLEVFAVSAYHFYRLIEVVIKAEGSFPRSIIKHLNRVSAL